MKYYIYVENGKLNGGGQAKVLNENILNYETTQQFLDEYIANKDKYIWDEENQEVILNPNYEQEQAQKELERIAMLNLTGADVERGIYKAKGMDFDDIIAYLEAQPLAEDGQPVVDIKALKIELKANNFYRGNPYVETIGKLLGFTDTQLNKFFETGDYKELLTQPEQTEENIEL